MARRHVINYFLEQENLYMEMLKVLAELKKCAANGDIPEEQYLNSEKEVAVIRDNYDRIAWIIHELNRPNERTKEEYIQDKNLYNSLKFASREAVLDESRDALAKLKELLAEKEK